jgi:hypothetical protein
VTPTGLPNPWAGAAEKLKTAKGSGAGLSLFAARR